MPSQHSMPGRTLDRPYSAQLSSPDVSRPSFTFAAARRRLHVAGWLLGAMLLCTLLPPAAAAAPAAADSSTRLSTDAAEIARRYVGAPYRYGGAGPRSFDCSGLTMFVFGQVGVRLPHNAARQFNANGLRIGSIAELAPGDLVFFVRTTGGRGITHAAIYVGDGMMVSANTPRTGVQLNSIHESYWLSRFAGGLRVRRERGIIRS